MRLFELAGILALIVTMSLPAGMEAGEAGKLSRVSESLAWCLAADEENAF